MLQYVHYDELQSLEREKRHELELSLSTEGREAKGLIWNKVIVLVIDIIIKYFVN